MDKNLLQKIHRALKNTEAGECAAATLRRCNQELDWFEADPGRSACLKLLSDVCARLARGVFCYPRLSEYGMKMILPEADEIAHAIAKQTHVRIVPFGDQAAYLVGLTGVHFSSTTYITDGAPRKIHLTNGRTIEFRHTSEMRIFAFKSRRMQLISNAVRALGKGNVKLADRETIKWYLDSVGPQEFEADIQLCPGWVRDILLDLKVN